MKPVLTPQDGWLQYGFTGIWTHKHPPASLKLHHGAVGTGSIILTVTLIQLYAAY